METALLLGSLLLQVRSIICDPTWSNKDPSWRPVSIFESVILIKFLNRLIPSTRRIILRIFEEINNCINKNSRFNYIKFCFTFNLFSFHIFAFYSFMSKVINHYCKPFILIECDLFKKKNEIKEMDLYSRERLSLESIIDSLTLLIKKIT